MSKFTRVDPTSLKVAQTLYKVDLTLQIVDQTLQKVDLTLWQAFQLVKNTIITRL